MAEYITSADAARILNVTPAAIHLMVHRGALPFAARTESGIYLFTRPEVEAVAERRAERTSARQG